MSDPKLGILAAIAVLSLAAGATMLRRAHFEHTQGEQQELAVARLAADNQRLSNMVLQANLTQAAVREQLQELTKLRADLSRARLEKDASNEVVQAQLAASITNQLHELAAIRNALGGLSDEIGTLRDAMEEFYSTPPAAPVQERAPERTAATPASSTPADTSLSSIRMIETHGDTFAEKLKSSASATEGESFQEVFGRFLRGNGIDLTGVGAMLYDDRTGRVILRGNRATLDAIERLTVALDGAQ